MYKKFTLPTVNYLWYPHSSQIRQYAWTRYDSKNTQKCTLVLWWLGGTLEPKSVSTNGAKSQSQTSRVPNVWPCHWLSKLRSKTKKVTSQSWAPLDAHYRWASFVADRPSTNARQRISVDGRSPYHCLHATGHAFYWRRLAQNGTRGWPNGWGSIQTGLFGVARLQTGLFGLALPLNIQN